MTDYAELVRGLYDALGTWQAVADACNNGTRHSAGYYQQIAKGRIRKPGVSAVEGIERAVASAETLLKRPWEREARYGFTILRCIGVRIASWRKAHGMTMNEWAEKAQELMEERYG